MNTYPFYTEGDHYYGDFSAGNVGGTGMASTATSLAEGRLVRDVQDKIFLLETNLHPLVTLTK